MHEILPLELLMPGEAGKLAEICGDSRLIHRLEEMGFRPGISIRMVQPGNPCIIAVDDRRISFRGEDAAMIFVTREHAAVPTA